MSWRSIIGGGIPVIGDIIGGFFDQKENNKNRQQQDQANQFNYDMQKEFAMNSLRWKAGDAVAAGFHPIAAFGAQGYSASPSAVGYVENSGRGSMARSMGQNLGRAFMATAGQNERQAAELSLERMKLENELLGAQIQSIRQVGPSFPTNTNDTFLQGQGDGIKVTGTDPRVIDMPFRRFVSDPNAPAKEAGAIPDYQLVRSANGYTVVPGADVKQRIEDDWLAEQQWKIRAYSAVAAGLIRLPNGERAFPNPMSGEMIPVSFFRRQGKRFRDSFINDAKNYIRGYSK